MGKETKSVDCAVKVCFRDLKTLKPSVRQTIVEHANTNAELYANQLKSSVSLEVAFTKPHSNSSEQYEARATLRALHKTFTARVVAEDPMVAFYGAVQKAENQAYSTRERIISSKRRGGTQ